MSKPITPALASSPPQTRRVGGRAASVGGKVCSLETTWKRSEPSWTLSARKSVFATTFEQPANVLFIAVLYKHGRADAVAAVAVTPQKSAPAIVAVPSCSVRNQEAGTSLTLSFHLYLYLTGFTENDLHIKVTASTQSIVSIALWGGCRMPVAFPQSNRFVHCLENNSVESAHSYKIKDWICFDAFQ